MPSSSSGPAPSSKNATAVAAAAARQGMHTMREDGIEKVKRGITSLVEVARVTTVL